MLSLRSRTYLLEMKWTKSCRSWLQSWRRSSHVDRHQLKTWMSTSCLVLGRTCTLFSAFHLWVISVFHPWCVPVFLWKPDLASSCIKLLIRSVPSTWHRIEFTSAFIAIFIKLERHSKSPTSHKCGLYNDCWCLCWSYTGRREVPQQSVEIPGPYLGLHDGLVSALAKGCTYRRGRSLPV